MEIGAGCCYQWFSSHSVWLTRCWYLGSCKTFFFPSSSLPGSGSSARCGGWSFTSRLSVLPADRKPAEGLQLPLLHVHRAEQREAGFTGAVTGRSAGLQMDEGEYDQWSVINIAHRLMFSSARAASFYHMNTHTYTHSYLRLHQLLSQGHFNIWTGRAGNWTHCTTRPHCVCQRNIMQGLNVALTPRWSWWDLSNTRERAEHKHRHWSWNDWLRFSKVKGVWHYDDRGETSTHHSMKKTQGFHSLRFECFSGLRKTQMGVAVVSVCWLISLNFAVLQCHLLFDSLQDLVDHINDFHVKPEKDSGYCCHWEGCARNGRGFNARCVGSCWKTHKRHTDILFNQSLHSCSCSFLVWYIKDTVGQRCHNTNI